MMEEIKNDFLSERHKYPKKLKALGRKIVGYLCGYCPEEILHAGGIIPIRVFGRTNISNSNLPGYYCGHARGCLDAGLRGEYEYLDGILYPNSCLHTKGAYDSWSRRFKPKYTWFIDMPSLVNTKEAIDFFIDELKSFCNSLMHAFSSDITEYKLKEAINFCNRERKILRDIYMKKKEDSPALSGTEVFSLILKRMMGARFGEELSEVIPDLNSRQKPTKKPVRIMIIGTEIHDPAIFSAIEEQGAIIVADTLCTGVRYIWEDVEPEGDPLRAIAKHYLMGVNCPLKHPFDRDIKFVEDILNKFNVEKAIFIWPDGCDPMGWIVPFLMDMLKKRGIPYRWIKIKGDGRDEDRQSVAQETEIFLRS